jgi:hypothetical protein
MQQPSVGRIVHYVSYGTPGGEYRSECRAATITSVGAWVEVEATETPEKWSGQPMRRTLQRWSPDAVSLFVTNPTGMFFNERCEHHGGEAYRVDDTPDRPTYRGGTWHWPERV